MPNAIRTACKALFRRKKPKPPEVKDKMVRGPLERKD